MGSAPLIDSFQGFEFGESNHAASWTGTLYIDVSSLYTFYLFADDGARLVIDGALTIDIDGEAYFGARERSGRVQLDPGPHSIYVAYYNIRGDRRIRLSWRALAAGIRKQVVPATAFLAPRLNSLQADYFALAHESFDQLPDLSARVATHSRRESRVNYEPALRWGGPNLTEGHGWAVRWEGNVYVPLEATYTWFVQSHGAARLILDERVIVDDSYTHSFRERSGAVALAAGIHWLRLDYFQALGEHGCVLQYESSQIDLRKQLVPLSAFVGGEALPNLLSPSASLSVETWLECGAEPPDCADVNSTFVRSSLCNSDGQCCPAAGQHFVLCAVIFEEAEAQSDQLILPPSSEGCAEASPTFLQTLVAAAVGDASMSADLCNLLCFGDSFFLLHAGRDCYCAPGLDPASLTVVDDSAGDVLSTQTACSAPCTGAPATACGGDGSAANLYERNTQHDSRQLVSCEEYSPATPCAQQEAAGAASCGSGLLSVPADCAAGRSAVCRRCIFFSRASGAAPPSPPPATPPPSVVSPRAPLGELFDGFSRPEACGGHQHHACFDSSSGEPTLGCLVPWDRCPSLMAEATAFKCGGGTNDTACDEACIDVRWRYECSTALLSAWATEDPRAVEIANAAWSFSIEVDRFDSGSFLGKALDATEGALRGIGAVLGELQRHAASASAALERLVAQLQLERQSICNSDLGVECGDPCTIYLFGFCVVPNCMPPSRRSNPSVVFPRQFHGLTPEPLCLADPVLVCRAVCRGQQLLLG